eukprot:CAMPEP_0174293508 /NCGR_PEP_ID=MMETSP0809-20121228/38823_1 /TAXON_ID=73025 ORGANISM="Eutreptiella gymnastica-like, Strain CCMP1594" /NCGR_SAMPLE_ID=MMETSP0809 /ASSEMBLY_ACC=CAM_ASM_000658 /LENGTH=47 /DNA_ID= /DNA_START= /DNA_END= /DNA_ORIENTATION=
MIERTKTGNSGVLCSRLGHTGLADHYGPWLCHDSAPYMGPYIGLADV